MKNVVCNFCCRWFHHRCALSAGCTSDGRRLCNYGCLQAYRAGRADANSKRLTLKCSLCPKTFANRSNLLTHVDGVHGSKRYGPCPSCRVDFRSKQKLTEHLKRCRRNTLQQLAALTDSEGDAAGTTQGDPRSPAMQTAFEETLQHCPLPTPGPPN